MIEYVYAVLNANSIVENIVVSENDQAEQALKMLIPEAVEIVKRTESTRQPYIGGDMLNGQFRTPSPYPSWLWDDESWSWIPPAPYPDDNQNYIWSEETTSWVPQEVEVPEPA